MDQVRRQRDRRDPRKGRGNTTADQTSAEFVSTAGQASEDGADGTAELVGDLLVGQSLEVRHHDWDAVLGRQRLDLGVEYLVEFHLLGRDYFASHFGERLLLSSSVVALLAGSQRSPIGNGVQPRTKRLAAGDGASFANQGEERRLEGVLGVLLMVEESLADAEHHTSVSPD